MEKKKLTANILFSGIGCQERGVENSNAYDLEVLSTSDVNKEAILAYAAIHCGLTTEMIDSYADYPPREEMAKELIKKHIGYDPDHDKEFDWMKLATKKNKELEKYWLAVRLSKNRGDISRIDRLPYADFWTVSFPCQSISIAGKMKGLNPDSGTRSSLIWENIRLLKVARDEEVLDENGNKSPYGNLPKYVMLENVKNLVSKKFIDDFKQLIEVFKTEFHMNCYWKVLNAKECGVPQNRERVFAIFIREDIDSGKFEFPLPFDTGIRLKDILADTVDEKYYINVNKAYDLVSRLQEKGELNHDSEMQPNTSTVEPYILTDCGGDFAHKADNACTLMARDWKGMNNYGSNGVIEKHVSENAPKRLGNIYGEQYTGGNFAGNVYDTENCSPTIMTAQGGNRQPMVLLHEEESSLKESVDTTVLNRAVGAEGMCFKVKQAVAQGYTECVDGGVADLSYPSSKTRRGRVQENGTVSPTICANGTELCRIETANPKITIGNVSYRIRRLTPDECLVLMGLNPDEADKMRNVGLANTHIYKCAGNGIVTNCVALIMQHLFKAQEDKDFFCDDELYN